MVILANLGLQVQVFIDGTPAPEYQDQKAEGHRSSTPGCHRYIESVAGSQFSISLAATSADSQAQDWFNAGNDHVFKFLVSVDGDYLGSTWINRKKKTRIFKNVWDHGAQRSFQFAAVNLVEDATKELEAEHREQFKDIGIIQISVYAAILTFHATAASKANEPDHQKNVTASGRHRSALPSGEGNLALSEKAVKGRAIAHGATLGPAIKVEPTTPTATTKRWQLIDSRDRPRAVFTFAYRSRDALKQELIIPQSPSPAPPDMNELSPEEIRRLAQERLSDIQGLKRGSSVKHKRAETAGSGRPLKFVRTSGGREVIDLTNE